MVNAWMKTLKKESDDNLRMFCFPHAGGIAQDYKKWVGYLPYGVSLYATQLPGRAERINEPLCSNFSIIIHQLVKSILPLLQSPYIFVGHSLGGAIAFEVAKAIRKLGYQLPSRLFVIGRGGPSIAEDNPTHNLPDEQFINYLRKQAGTNEKLFEQKEFIQFFMPIVRNDMKLADTYHEFYRKEQPLACPIHAFWGTAEINLIKEEVEDWVNETSSIFTVDQFDGTHFFLHEHTDKVIQKIFQYGKAM